VGSDHKSIDKPTKKQQKKQTDRQFLMLDIEYLKYATYRFCSLVGAGSAHNILSPTIQQLSVVLPNTFVLIHRNLRYCYSFL